MVTLVLARDAGQEGTLRGQNISNRQSAELMIESLKTALYQGSKAGLSPGDLWNKYKRNGSDTTYSTLSDSRYQLLNPENGQNEMLNGQTSAWIQEHRGHYYHIAARVKVGATDITTHRWVQLSPCQSGGTLTTILSGVPYPGFNATVVDPSDGRVFFGSANNTSVAPSNLYSWHPSTGLSTIVSGRPGVGNRSLFMGDDGRVFFGEGPSGNDTFWTWKAGVLSTVVSGLNGAGRACETCGMLYGARGGKVAALDKVASRIYVGTQSGGKLYTWKDNVLQTIFNSGTAAAKMAVGGSNELFWMDKDLLLINQLYRWTPATGTQNVASLIGISLLAQDGFSVTSNGRVFFSILTIGPLLAPLGIWQSGTGLNLALDRQYQNAVGPANFHEFPSGQVFIGAYGLSGIWSPGAPNNVQLLSNNAPGGMAFNGNLMAFGDSTANGGVYAWTPSGGLSTITTGIDYPGENEGMLWSGGKLYFGQRKPNGSLYAWDAQSGALTSIALPNVDNPAIKASIAADASGTVYFGSDSAVGGAWAYNESQGLTPIVTNRPSPGVYSMSAHPHGGVYFGEYSSTGNFYYYLPKRCEDRTY